MTYIEVNGKIYTFYNHALERMQQRGISFEWVESAILDPDDRVAISSERYGYDKEVEIGRHIRVVVNEVTSEIITAFFMDEA